MKTTVTLYNPPYNPDKDETKSTNNRSIYKDFKIKDTKFWSAKLSISVFPCKWTGIGKSSLFKTFMFNESGLKKILWTPDNIFEGTIIHGGTAFYVCEIGYTGDIEYVYLGKKEDGYSQKLSFKYNFKKLGGIPLVKSKEEFDFVLRVIEVSKKSNLGQLYTKNPMYRNGSYSGRKQGDEKLQIKDSQTSTHQYPLILNLDRMDSDFNLAYTDEFFPKVCYDKWRVGIAMMGSTNSIGNNIKIIPPGYNTTHSVVVFPVENEQQAKNLQSYLQLDIIKKIIKLVKISTPNSKGVCSQIPLFDLNCKYTNKEVEILCKQ